MDSCNIIPPVQVTKDGDLVEEPSVFFQELLDSGLSRDEAVVIYAAIETSPFTDTYGEWRDDDSVPTNAQGQPILSEIDPEWILDTLSLYTPSDEQGRTRGQLSPSDFLTPRALRNDEPRVGREDSDPRFEAITDPDETRKSRQKEAIEGALRALEIRIVEFQGRSGDKAQRGAEALRQTRDEIEALVAKNMLEEALIKWAEHATSTLDKLKKRLDAGLDESEMGLTDLHEIYSYAQGYRIVSVLVGEINNDAQLKAAFQDTVLTALRTVESDIKAIEGIYQKYARLLIAKKFAHLDGETEYRYRGLFLKEYKAGTLVQEGEDEATFLARRFFEKREEIQRAQERSVMERLTFLSHDVGEFERFVQGIQHLDDRILQMTHEMIYRQHELIRSDYNMLEARFHEVYAALLEHKGGDTDQRKLYEEMLEVDDDGNLTGHIVSEYKSGFSEAMFEMLAESRELERAGKKAQAKALRRKWYAENAVKNPERVAAQKKMRQIARQEGTAAAAAYMNRWRRENPGAQMALPGKAWLNPQYQALMDLEAKHPVRAFYDTFVQAQARFDSVRPADLQLGSQLAGIRKDAMERLLGSDGGVMANGFEIMREAVQIQQDDDEYGTQYAEEGIDGKPRKRIPIYYTQTFRSEIIKRETEGMTRDERAAWLKANKKTVADYVQRNQSFDLTSLALSNAYTSLQYYYLDQILPEIHALDVLMANRKVSASERGIKRLYRKVRGDEVDRDAVKDDGGRAYQVFRDLVDRDVYGEKKIRSKHDKKWDMLARYVSGTMLQLNLFSGIRNVSAGWILTLTEAAGGRYIDRKGWQTAHRRYFQDMPSITGDIGRNESQSLTNLLSEEFDADNSFSGRRHRYADTNWLLKQAHSDTLFGLTSMGEHFLAHMTMYAVLHKVEARDEKGESLGPLVDLYSRDEEGKLVLTKTPHSIVWDGRLVAWDADAKFRVTQRIRHINERLHGAYSQQNAPLIQRHVAGRMVMMMRKWVVPGFTRRWGGAYRVMTGRQALVWQQQVSEHEEGSYVSLLKATGGLMSNHGPEFLQRLLRDTERLQFMVQADWSEMSDFQRSNVKKAVAEVAFFVALWLAANLMDAMGEDEEDEEVKAWINRGTILLYQLEREIGTYFLPQELHSNFKDISPMVSWFVTLGNAIMHLDGERYVSGRREGRLKLEKDLIRLMPFYRHWDRWAHPEEMISFFNDKR